MARKFLYIIAAIIVLVIAALAALRIWSTELTAVAFVPRAQFTAQAAAPANAYDDPALWFSRAAVPGPAGWLPEGAKPDTGVAGATVFFIHPTSYLASDRWNGPLDDRESRGRAELFIRAMASPFGGRSDIWAPRYRQAVYGAFLTDKPEAARALDLAYGDVLAAFDAFVAAQPADRPLILAGHSQGAFHLKRLLKERVAGTPLAARVIAAYAVGWPVSLEHDLPAMGLPACARPDQAGCVMSWLSYAEPADTAMFDTAYAYRRALDGKGPKGSAFLCSNPLNGGGDNPTPTSNNLGTLVPNDAITSGKLVPGMVSARCGKDGFLYIGEGPQLGPYVLPGNNYHVYDIPLFWANLRADAARRADSWRAQH